MSNEYRVVNQSTNQPINKPTAHDRSIAFLIGGFLLACYLLTYTGVIQSSDGLSMFATTESMVRNGEIDSNQLLWMGLQQGAFGPDGSLYGRKGVGMALLALPLVWVALKWAALGLVQTALLLNPILIAWTGGLVYRAGRRLGWSQQVAVITALVFGLATLAWPYAQTFFSDPVAGWGLFAAFYGLLSYDQTRRKRYLALAGLTWGLAYLARSINLVTLPLYALALLAILVQGSNWRANWRTNWRASLRRLLLDRWRPWTTFALPVILAGLVSLWWNFARYGNLLDSGYLEAESFSANLMVGVFGLLIGPARGLIWYSPVLLLAIPGAVRLGRAHPWPTGLALAVSAVYVLLYAKWFMWHGGFSWGPRFLVPLMPFLALLTGPAWAALTEKGWGGSWARWAAAGLTTLSVGVQWLGMTVPFSLAQEWLAANVQPLFAPETFTRLGYSPLILQWRFLGPDGAADNLIFAWWRAGQATGALDWIGFALPLAGLLVGGGLILRLVQTDDDPVNRENAETLSGERTRNALYALALALALITVALLVHYRLPLSGTDTPAIAARIQTLEKPGDAILHLSLLETQTFANVYHGRSQVYGLTPQADLDADAQGWLARMAADHRRLWVAPDYAAPQDSGWERTLRADAFLLLDERPTGEAGRRVALYALAGVQPLAEAGMGTLFGLPGQIGGQIRESEGWAKLGGYAITQNAQPGGEILLALRWESLRAVAQEFHVFVHLLNAQGEKVAQRDGQPVLWQRPTSTWRPGEEILDRYGLLLAPDLPPGPYTLSVGLYDPATGARLPISAGPQDSAIDLGPITVGDGK